MTLQKMDLQFKDFITLGFYILSATILFASLHTKVDSLSEAVKELKGEKKEEYGETKIMNATVQNELKALSIRVELDHQNITIMQHDIQMLKIEYQKKK